MSWLLLIEINSKQIQMNKPFLILLIVAVVFAACNTTSEKKEDKAAGTQPEEALESRVEHPDWSKKANIYEVNIRQYTPEGTISAFIKHLPRLKNMGVDILWLMPVHPIGEKNRKGTLGSYYSMQDYTAVNPEFGKMSDFKNMVKLAH